MRVVCPYTPACLRPETVAALTDTGYPYDLVDVSGSDTAYADLVERLWAEGRDFLLVEHDMLPTSEAVAAMAGCPRLWCANPYPVNHQVGEWIIGHGFARYRAELMAAEPDAAEAAGAAMFGQRWPLRHWACIDSRLARVLTSRPGPGGRPYEPHRHQPPVGHLHLV